jgi:hypothetical protein
MSDTLIDPRFLFRFAAPLLHCDKLWSDSGVKLSEKHRLVSLAELEGAKPIADLRAAWSETGLAFTVRVKGKRQPPWCRESRLEDSDGLQVWIDTRDTHNIHRASRFCNRFAFLPAGGPPKHTGPVADQLIINRARENAPAVRPQMLKVRSEKRVDGYLLEGFLPAEAISGFDPAEHPRLGFTYALFDRELGLQTFSVGTGYPYEEDPSVWATLELAS